MSKVCSYINKFILQISAFQHFNIPFPFIKVKVSALPFNLATLEVDRLAARILLSGIKRTTKVVIYNHSERVDAAQEEEGFFLVLGVGRYAERHINGHPSQVLDINLAPVVQVLVAWVQHKATLKVAGYAYRATEGEEQQRYLSAVAMVVGQHIFRNIFDGRIFAC